MESQTVFFFLWDKIHDACYQFSLPSRDNNEFGKFFLSGLGFPLAYPTQEIFSINTAIDKCCPEVGDRRAHRVYCSVNRLLWSSSSAVLQWGGTEQEHRERPCSPCTRGRGEIHRSRVRQCRISGRMEAYVKGRRQEEVSWKKITREHIVKAQNKTF